MLSRYILTHSVYEYYHLFSEQSNTSTSFKLSYIGSFEMAPCHTTVGWLTQGMNPGINLRSLTLA